VIIFPLACSFNLWFLHPVLQMFAALSALQYLHFLIWPLGMAEIRAKLPGAIWHSEVACEAGHTSLLGVNVGAIFCRSGSSDRFLVPAAPGIRGAFGPAKSAFPHLTAMDGGNAENAGAVFCHGGHKQASAMQVGWLGAFLSLPYSAAL
jgi:hypothetical protein